MDSVSVLIGGQAGDGINEAGIIIARVFCRLGYVVYQYLDYPSLIRGGHNFSIVRADKVDISAYKDHMNFLIALNQDTFDLHKGLIDTDTIIITDSGHVRVEGLDDHENVIPVHVDEIISAEDAPKIMRNTCLLGAFCSSAGISFDILKDVLDKHIPVDLELNLKIARLGFEAVKPATTVQDLKRPALPVVTGNDAIGLGLLKGGLKSYVAYPMTPSSGVLHFLAGMADTFDIKVVHPENEISVVTMALGMAYAGQKVAVGTSGGGFCLMTEGLSLAGQAELPITFVISQRAGPSTGVPTYTAQSDLHFVINAGQGEFPRLVVGPGDANEAFYWSSLALGLSWKHQIPSFILVDKTVSESAYCLDIEGMGNVKPEDPVTFHGSPPYKRYEKVDSGVSPLAFPSTPDVVVKVNSYTHDEYGITTEDAGPIAGMQDKRSKKWSGLLDNLKDHPQVKVYGNYPTAVICYGSCKGACIEAGELLGLKVIQLLVLHPFPYEDMDLALKGVDRSFTVECNSTGQLATLLKSNGLQTNGSVLKYDGRPFTVDELKSKLEVIV